MAHDAGSLQGDPLRQAELYATFGSVYRRLGDYSKAEENLNSAWLLRRQLTGPIASLAAESRIALGLVHANQDQFEKAETEVRVRDLKSWSICSQLAILQFCEVRSVWVMC